MTEGFFSINFRLTGDSNSLSNWEYKDNQILTLLTATFSIIIAVYFMNVLIGILNIIITEIDFKVLQLRNKASVFTKYHYITVTLCSNNE